MNDQGRSLSIFCMYCNTYLSTYSHIIDRSFMTLALFPYSRRSRLHKSFIHIPYQNRLQCNHLQGLSAYNWASFVSTSWLVHITYSLLKHNILSDQWLCFVHEKFLCIINWLQFPVDWHAQINKRQSYKELCLKGFPWFWLSS